MFTALFGKSKRKTAPSGPPQDVAWAKSPKNRFYNFLNLDAEEKGLTKVSGVYVVWHGGLRPEWLYVGQSDNLAATFEALRDNNDIMEYDRHGHLFVTWSEIKPEFQPGVVQYLIDVLNPLIENPLAPDEDEPPIPVFPPGIRGA